MSRSAAAAMSLLALCMLIFSVDYNIVYVALPQIGADVGFSVQSLQWVVSAYALGLGGFLLLGGRAVDRLGARRMLLAAVGLYAVASLAGGLATTPPVLIGARIGQGLGGALLFPATLALLQTTFAEGPARNRAFAWWGTAGAGGAIAGAMLGGVLTAWLGWQAVFLVNLPLCALAAAGALTQLAPDRPRTNGSGGFGILSAICATAGCTALLYGLISAPESQWRAPQSLGAIAAGVLLLAGFATLQRFSADPVAAAQLLRIRGLAIAVGIVFVFQGAVNMLHYVFVVHLQDVLGYGPWQAGMAMVPMSALAMLGANRLLPWTIGRYGIRAALFGGMLGVGTSMILLAAAMSAGGTYWALLPAVALWGTCAGTLYPAMFLAAGQDVDPAHQGVASGLTQTSAQIGGAVGLAALIAVANAGLDLAPGTVNAAAQVVAGLRTAAFTGGLAMALAALLAFRLPRRAPDVQPA